MKLAIIGSRDFNDFDLLCKECDKTLNNENNIIIISGEQVVHR